MDLFDSKTGNHYIYSLDTVEMAFPLDGLHAISNQSTLFNLPLRILHPK